MIKIFDIFDIIYGVNLEFQNMEISEDGIPFISRTEKNNGVAGFVKKISSIKPNPANTISVACGGSVMASFLQTCEYYSGRDVIYLVPKAEMSERQLLYYCMCLRANRYRYNYGRQANKTIGNILVPNFHEIPQYVSRVEVRAPSTSSLSKERLLLNSLNWELYKLSDFFDMFAGKYYDASKYKSGSTPLISSSDKNNGAMVLTDLDPLYENCLTIGKIGASTYYQDSPFVASSDVTILKPKDIELNKYLGSFLTTILNKEKQKWSYGRQIRLNDCKKLQVSLPIDGKGNPDWAFMENYIKSLPYSEAL